MDLELNRMARLAQELNVLQRLAAELRDAMPAADSASGGGESRPCPPAGSAPAAAPAPPPAESNDGERLLKEIVQHSPDGVFALDREGTVTVWNAEMERIFGLPSADAVGRHVFDVLARSLGAGAEEHLLQALRGETVALAGQILRAGDEPAYYEAQFLPWRDDKGNPAGIIGFIRDVTGRKRAFEEQAAMEARYRELFENANDMVYTMDRQGRLTSVNRAAERLTGYAREELLQMKLADLVVPEQRAAVESILSRETGAPGTYELDILTKNGERLALEISAHWIARQGQGVGLQGIARDVTERRRTEEALQQAKQKLEAWVGELEQRTREMTLLSEMGDMLRACLTTDEAYSVIVRVAQQVFPVEVGALYVITPARNMVEAVALWGNPNLAERVFAPEECWALRRGRVHWVEDASAGLVCSHVKELPPDGYLCVPMMAQSEALGVLHLMQPRAARLTEAKQRLAVAMAEHIAMALSNLKLHETLRSQSIRDPLTGLFNRRFMEESLELELRRAVRNQRPLSVIMLDLDGFKRFNDSHGHDAGDALLRELGALLQGNIRAEDIACRYGGEEFTLIMPEGSAEIAAQRAELLRAAIKKLEVEHRGRTLGSVTASLGVAVFPEHGRTRDALLEAADAALYLSKGAGGDKVTLAR
jgi:diguanylate cyclase (GGDEF)-like protein/PAS domain S-box-containing protein